MKAECVILFQVKSPSFLPGKSREPRMQPAEPNSIKKVISPQTYRKQTTLIKNPSCCFVAIIHRSLRKNHYIIQHIGVYFLPFQRHMLCTENALIRTKWGFHKSGSHFLTHYSVRHLMVWVFLFWFCLSMGPLLLLHRFCKSPRNKDDIKTIFAKQK